MRKFLAVLLAVVMTASLSVVGLAEDGIQTYGGATYETTMCVFFKPVKDREYIADDGYPTLVNYGIGVPDETAENSGEGVKEWTAPKVEFEITGNELVKEGLRIGVYNYFGEVYPDIRWTSFGFENESFKVVKQEKFLSSGMYWYGCMEYVVKPATPLTEAGTIEDTLIIKSTNAAYKDFNNIADKDDGPFTYKFPVAITVTGDIPAGGGNSGGGAAADDDDDNESPTENAANDDKTLDKLSAGESAEVKLVSGSAALSTDTMDTLGGHGGKLTVTVDKMTVVIPGGFGKVTEPGRIYYPLDFTSSLPNASDLAAAVKGDKAKTEVVKAGGNMVMPTTVTVTLKTKLTGTVHVYHYNEETRRYTLIASPVAQDGKITFTTKQMGHLVLTTGTI